MKNSQVLIFAVLLSVSVSLLTAYTVSARKTEKVLWKQITAIESVVPGGLGRSRLISIDSDGTMEEVKLQNFFSMAGINFQNIKDNDLAITDKIATLSDEGWELYNVTTGSFSGNTANSNGLFITRYLFKKVE